MSENESDGALSDSLETERVRLVKDSQEVKTKQKPSLTLSNSQWIRIIMGAFAMIIIGIMIDRIIIRQSLNSSLSLASSASAASSSAASDGGATSGKEIFVYRQYDLSGQWSLPSQKIINSAAASSSDDDINNAFPSLEELVNTASSSNTHKSSSSSSTSPRYPGLSTLVSCMLTTNRVAVMTSISSWPTAAEIGMTLLDEPWCMIVIGDKKGPNYHNFSIQLEYGINLYIVKMSQSQQTETPLNDKINRQQILSRLAYIDVSEQSLLPYSLTSLTPYGSFSRKNLGFLLAIHSGASMIFDVDDDNIYLPNTGITGNKDLPIDHEPREYLSSEALHYKQQGKVYKEIDHDSKENNNGKPTSSSASSLTSLFTNVGIDSFLPSSSSLSSLSLNNDKFLAPPKSYLSPVDVSLFNPYPQFGVDDSWPRGFPLRWIKPTLSPPNNRSYFHGNCINERVRCSGVVQQYLASHDPDVDAIYRLTNPRKLPFDFMSEADKMTLPVIARDTPSIALKPKTFAPFNAQATIITPGAFLTMMLPSSVHGRVADIWRSYFMETLMSYYSVDMKNEYKIIIKNNGQPSSPDAADACMIFTAPHIYHDRNSHNYQLDFNSEIPLYTQAEPLTAWLTKRLEGGENDLLKRVKKIRQTQKYNNNQQKDKFASLILLSDLLVLLYSDLTIINIRNK